MTLACVAPAALAQGAYASQSLTANPVSATEGQGFSGTVGSISNCSGSERATIDWGDGSGTQDATVGPPQGGTPGTASATCSIGASHTYAEEGSYKATVGVSTSPTVGSQESATSTATVADGPLTVTAQTLVGTPGRAASGVVATFGDSAGLEPSSSYTATINWGDGQSSPGTVTAGQVSATHTYAAAGQFNATVNVADEGGSGTGAVSTVLVHACSALSTTPAPSFLPGGGNPNQRYVQALFHDLLGRSPSAQETSHWANALSLGVTRGQLALALETSAESRVDVISSFYQGYLHRQPSASELAFWQFNLAPSGGDEQLQSQLLGSAEYFQTQGGAMQAGFLTALYCDALHRPVDPGGQSAADQALAGGATRAQLAQTLLSSPEYFQDLVRGWYLRYLRRAADASGLSFYTAFLQQGGSDQQGIASLVSSDAYFNQFVHGSAFANPAINGRGLISLVLHHTATLSLVVLRVVHPGTPAPRLAHVAAVLGSPLLQAPKVRRVGVVALGHHRAGKIKVRWNRKVGRHKLARGRYLLELQARVGNRLTDVSDVIPFSEG